MNGRFFDFVGGDQGEWCVRQQFTVSGQPYETRFDDMLAELRASAEWRFVAREVDIRLQRA